MTVDVWPEFMTELWGRSGFRKNINDFCRSLKSDYIRAMYYETSATVQYKYTFIRLLYTFSYKISE